MIDRIARFVRAAAVAAFCTAGAVTPASAIVITGAWDPVYGAPFDTAPDVLGWRGSATFEIPDVCIATGIVSSTTCAGMKLDTAQVVFYDVLGGGTTIETFNYGANDLSSFAVNFGADGSILGLTSAFFSPVFPTSTFADINYYGFLLQFVSGGVQMYHSVDLVVYNQDYIIPPKYCFSFVPGFICGYSGTYSDPANAPPPGPVALTFRVVPEPGALALVAAALVSGWAFTRRRQGALAPAPRA